MQEKQFINLLKEQGFESLVVVERETIGTFE